MASEESRLGYRELIQRFEHLADKMEQAASLADAEPILLEADRLHDQCSEQIQHLKAIAQKLRSE